jgi:predicted PurR-regulated permease PerM
MRVEVHVPWSTLAKLGLAMVLAWAAGVLAPLAMTLLLSALLATSLHPVVAWLERRMARGWAVLIVGTVVIAALLGTLVLVIPPIVGQASAIIDGLPDLRAKALAALPEGAVRAMVERGFAGAIGDDLQPAMHHALGFGRAAVGGLVELGMIVILAIYLLLDADGVLRWLIAFLPNRLRGRVHETAQEMAPVVFAYVAGQVITSALCTVFTFVVLAWLKVPAALLLAVLAGILDVLPVVGFVVSAAPAVMLAAMVSPATAMIVLGFYLLYNAVENYAIVPYVYGTRLRLSTLTVLVTMLASFIVAGTAGAIAALPLVASFPIIERRWLTPWLHPDTVRSHERLEREAAEEAKT